MIKISKSATELVDLAKEHYKQLELPPFQLSLKLQAILDDTKIKPFERLLFNQLKRSLKELIIAPPQDLIKLDKILNPLYQTYVTKKTFGKKGKDKLMAIKKANEKILGVFCYSDFISKADGKYAYELTEKLGVDVCVYCNRQYTFTLHTGDGKCRPTLDHFLDKGKHPYFAVSFYNLIPSCYVCNSSLKNQKLFSVDKNLHPFVESMLDVLEFTLDIRKSDFISGKKKDFNIRLIPSKKCKDSDLLDRATSNASVFKIEELYQGHKDYASEIIKKAYYYTNTKITELYKYRTKSGEKLFSSKEEVIEFALGNYVNEQKLGKRVLSKLTRDLAKDLGLLKYI